MAGILKRFTDIMSANINALLDKAEDPEKMIDQYLRNLESDLGNVKAETAAVMAEEARAKREIAETENDIIQMDKYAEKAVLAGNDQDALQFLEKKATLTKKLEVQKQSFDLAAANSVKMREMHDKLVKDMAELNSRKEMIKAKLAVAKTQKAMNEMGSSINGAGENLSAFDKMEEKANRMLDEANAMAELNKDTDSIEDLTSKYDSEPTSQANDELAALKARLNK